MSATQKVPPLWEREQPGLSKTLPFPRALDRCQSCGVEGDANRRGELTTPLFHSGSLQKWQEADPNDRFTADDGHPVIVILCADCAKHLIDRHPQLYRQLDAWHPIPGVMGLCQGCRFHKELTCTHPWLKANGDEGLHVRFPKPNYCHVNYGRGRGEFKHLAKWYRDPAHPERLDALNALFLAPQRIQREASAAAGRWIPMVQENVRGAQPWVGRARWHYGSYYLWGDVPALMPITQRGVKVGGIGSWRGPSDPRHVPGLGFNTHADRATRQLGDGIKAGDRNKGRENGAHKWTTSFEEAGIKNSGGSWFNVAHNTTSGTNNNPARGEGIKQGGDWFGDSTEHALRRHSSKSHARKAASARIAKIPYPLARHIAQAFAQPSTCEVAS